LAADRYHDRPKVASMPFTVQDWPTKKQAQTADYDQSAGGQAIATFTDFKTSIPTIAGRPEPTGSLPI